MVEKRKRERKKERSEGGGKIGREGEREPQSSGAKTLKSRTAPTYFLKFPVFNHKKGDLRPMTAKNCILPLTK